MEEIGMRCRMWRV